MGIQTMGSLGSDQQSHLHELVRQNSWFNLILDEVGNQLRDFDKPLGRMNLDELLKNIWTTKAKQSESLGIDNASSAFFLQHQASLTLARAFSGKTVDEVWRDIQQGQKMRKIEMNDPETDPTLGETTLGDFLVKAGLFVAEASLGPSMELANLNTPQIFTPQVGLSQSPSIDALSDMPEPGWTKGAANITVTLERRLKRKIKNRESAARSRARKQAYQNELVNKVSRLEEQNMKLKKEKELEEMFDSELCSGTRYQLRRTSSL